MSPASRPKPMQPRMPIGTSRPSAENGRPDACQSKSTRAEIKAALIVVMQYLRTRLRSLRGFRPIRLLKIADRAKEATATPKTTRSSDVNGYSTGGPFVVHNVNVNLHLHSVKAKLRVM